MKIHTIDTGLFKLDGGAMFGVVPKTLWNKYLPADKDNLCELAMRCLLIEEDGRLILIDTGIGNKQDAKFLGYYHLHGENTLEKSLAKYGFAKEDITDVFLTHLHLDHVGGAVEYENGTLAPTFKNAIYWSNEEHWRWATQPNPREKASFLKENLLPLQESGQLKFLSPSKAKKAAPFTENVQARVVSGHTQAMMLPQIRYKDQIIVYVADLIPTVAHLPIPWVASYDVHPLQAMKEKALFLEEALQNGYILYFEHDADTECCTVGKNEKGKIVLRNRFRLSEL